jgi:hypothetical protein
MFGYKIISLIDQVLNISSAPDFLRSLLDWTPRAIPGKLVTVLSVLWRHDGRGRRSTPERRSDLAYSRQSGRETYDRENHDQDHDYNCCQVTFLCHFISISVSEYERYALARPRPLSCCLQTHCVTFTERTVLYSIVKVLCCFVMKN